MSGFLLAVSISNSALTIGLALTIAGAAIRTVLIYTSVALALYWLIVGALFVRTRIAHSHRKRASSTPSRRD